MIPFRTQFDKIVGAYLRDELSPMNACACFIGNLLNNTNQWVYGREYDGKGICFRVTKKIPRKTLLSLKLEADGMYSMEDIVHLENMFLKSVYPDSMITSKTEETLFKAMEVTLEALRKLHEAKGEVVEDYVFKKRSGATLTKTSRL